MDIDLSTAEEIAKQYFGTTQSLARLGWGISGFVYLSPDLVTVVKVHRAKEGFERELATYQRLAQIQLTRLLGLTVPKLRDYRRSPNIIRMDLVRPPYLLDFAGVSFDPPDFSSDVMASWHEELAERFGPNVSVAYSVYAALARHGIYYLDLRPSNLNLEGLPGLAPPARQD